ncbi:DUF4328 domain-containing protein [Luteolibacter sp. Populi]|uniref:DUF4328 domain-containing protein n=1 Tax=Luteolibacter sp. Populi TaxID=3230487 RepID=UPI0034671529
MDNPYQPPLAEAPSYRVTGALRPLRPLANVSLRLYGVSTMLQLADHVYRMVVPLPFEGSGNIHDTYHVEGIGILDGLMIATGLASSVLYLVWKYRAAFNARILDPATMTVSPAMAVGSYFIPLVNFVVPYQAMAGIARASRLQQKDVGLWWAGHVGCLLLTIAYFFVEGMETPLRPTLLDHVFMVVAVLTFYFSWVLVTRITRAQMDEGWRDKAG